MLLTWRGREVEFKRESLQYGYQVKQGLWLSLFEASPDFWRASMSDSENYCMGMFCTSAQEALDALDTSIKVFAKELA